MTSTTTCAPVSASVKPSPVIELMPCEGDAATTSWPPARRRFTTLLPMSPVPPRTTIFIFLFSVADDLSFITMDHPHVITVRLVASFALGSQKMHRPTLREADALA